MSLRIENIPCALYLQIITQSPESNKHYFNYLLILIELGQTKLELNAYKIGEVYINSHVAEKHATSYKKVCVGN